MSRADAPYPIFTGLDNRLLDNGYIWFGVENDDPETNPVAIYSDEAMTVPVAQPVRTKAGLLVDGDDPIGVFVASAYSIRIRNFVGVEVLYVPSAYDLGQLLGGGTGSASIGFLQSGTGAVARTVQDKARETVSITDFGAVAGDTGDQTAAIQKAIDAVHAAGGGRVTIPRGRYRFLDTILLREKVELCGSGRASTLHFVNNTRADAIVANGTSSSVYTDLTLRDFSLEGDAAYEGGSPTVVNGQGIILHFCDDSEVSGVWVSGFSDGGIFFFNSNRSMIRDCRVRFVAQGLGFCANEIDSYGNIAIGNRISDTGTYNALHLEGSFGLVGTGEGVLYDTVLVANTIIDSYETGINIELAPRTTCVGNTVLNSGYGGTPIGFGIKVYGGFQSTIAGNVVSGSGGYGILIGANSGECAVSGNVTHGNAGSLLLSDGTVAASFNVEIGSNNFIEGSIAVSGNVTVRPTTIEDKIPVLKLKALSATKRNAQINFENSVSSDRWRLGVDIETDNGATDFGLFRDGVGTAFAVTAGGQAKALNSFAVAGTKVVGAQGAAVANATDAASVITQLNALLARCRAHGLIAP